jgi:hypothetical protein
MDQEAIDREERRRKHREEQQKRRAALPNDVPGMEPEVVERQSSITAKIAVAASMFSFFYMMSYTEWFHILETATNLVLEGGLPKFNQTLTQEECSEYLLAISETIYKIKEKSIELGFDSSVVPYNDLSVQVFQGQVKIKLKDSIIDLPPKPALLVGILALQKYGNCDSTILIEWGEYKLPLDELILIIVENPKYKQQFVRQVFEMIQMSQSTIATFEPIDEIFLHDTRFDINSLSGMQTQLYNNPNITENVELFIRSNFGNNIDEFNGKLMRIGGGYSLSILYWLFTSPYGILIVLIGLYTLPNLIRMVHSFLYSYFLSLFRQRNGTHPLDQAELTGEEQQIIREHRRRRGQPRIEDTRGGGGKIIITNETAEKLYSILQNLKKFKQLILKKLETDYPTEPITIKLKEIETKKHNFRLVLSNAWKKLPPNIKRTFKGNKGGKRKSFTKKRRTNKNKKQNK